MKWTFHAHAQSPLPSREPHPWPLAASQDNPPSTSVPQVCVWEQVLYTLWKYQTYNKKLKCQFTYRYNDKNYGCLLILANIGYSA